MSDGFPRWRQPGTPFYDDAGKAKDCLQILKDEGINAIRLRVWVNPKDGWCGTDDVVKMAKRATAMGFRIMIDFHYSDSWADPQQQPKPAAWMNHDFAQLQQDVYAHTFAVLTALKQAGVTPNGCRSATKSPSACSGLMANRRTWASSWR